jgi:hypothetical protein
MRAPWFSGMAQGQILSAIARLYEITKNQKYDSVCVKIFNSFKRFKGQHDPWIVHIDEHGYYWIEEYPEHDPNHVLNGFVFALFGLYDYYLLHKDPDVKKYLLAGITTVADHLVLYRRPDKPSFYCLKYNVFYPEYHLVHTDQIKFLQKLTQDKYIQNMYEIYYQDYHE